MNRIGSTTLPALPTLNALLNLTSAVLLSVGYAHIRRRKVAAHHRSMLAACECISPAATFAEAPTARNSNLLPVKANGLVRLRSV